MSRSSEPITVLALSGSLRRRSWNRLLLEAAAARATDGVRISIYDGMASIPLFNEDVEKAVAGGGEEVARLRDQVRAADGLWIATPEYNQSIPGVLKNTIDWLSRSAPDEVLAGKPVAIMGASIGPWGTRLSQAALRQVLHATEAYVIQQPQLYVREAARAFDDAGRLIDARIDAKLDSILKALLTAIRNARLVASQADQQEAG